MALREVQLTDWGLELHDGAERGPVDLTSYSLYPQSMY